MLKVMGCILIIFSASLAGFYFSGRLNQRKNFLKAFISFLKSLEIQLRYSGEDIFQLIPKCSDSEILKPFFINLTAEKVKDISFSELWRKAVNSSAKSCNLKKSDCQALIDFGGSLGTTDTSGELSHIKLYEEVFSKALENAQEDLDKKSKLYKAMGFFLGTSIALMIV